MKKVITWSTMYGLKAS